jgi:hypothetical protein
MQRRKLERWLRAHDARLERHGRSHDVWTRAGKQATVPRHGEINTHTARAICEQLAIPIPPGR